MSGVGSTNAMKKGSGNNPFLAYSEADMQSYLNAAYVGCIVKYTGPSTKSYVNIGSQSFDAQNLVVDTGIPFLFKGGSAYSLKLNKINNDNTVTTSYIAHRWIRKDNGNIYSTIGSSEQSKYVYTLLEMSEEDYLKSNVIVNPTISIKDITVRFLAVAESVSETPSLINLNSAWPLTKGTNGWQTGCFNADGRITLWGYGETITCVDVLGSSPPNLYCEPYIVNELYKVVYGDGQYYFEEFCYISEDVTTGTVEDVAPGKTFYDFTGTKQTGTGTKINPYLAADLDTFKSFPKGSYIKWLGINNTLLEDGTKLYKNSVYQGVDDGDTTAYVILPTLTNEGTASDLAEGKELINSKGEVVVGTATDGIDYTQDVMFWDYNGKLVYACTLEEAKAMTKLPDAPNHTDKGLAFFKWNYTLEEVNTLTNGVDIGALYMPSDEKTHLFIKTNDNLKHIELYIYKSNASRGASIEIDWGDESVEQYSWDQNTTPSVISHDYANAAEYEIIIENTSESSFNRANYLNLGKTGYSISEAQNLFGVNIRYGRITTMATTLTKVYLGKQMNANCGCCPNLVEFSTYMVIPPAGLQYSNVKHVNAMGEIGYNAFTNSAIETFSLNGNDLAPNFFSSNLKRIACLAYTQTYADTVNMQLYQLRRCIWPRISNYRLSATFTACQKIRLDILTVYDNDNTSVSYYFNSATELYTTRLYPYGNNTSIPASIVNAPLLEKFILDNSTPVSLSAAFTYIPSTCKYYVPDDSVDAYKAATGWSDMADRIYPISELNQ